jgi:hypothetical protein
VNTQQLNLQFGCPTVEPMIARPYAVERVPSATNTTTHKLKALTICLLPKPIILANLHFVGVEQICLGDVVNWSCGCSNDTVVAGNWRVRLSFSDAGLLSQNPSVLSIACPRCSKTPPCQPPTWMVVDRFARTKVSQIARGRHAVGNK